MSVEEIKTQLLMNKMRAEAEAAQDEIDRLTSLLERAERDKGDLLHAVSCYLAQSNWTLLGNPLPVLTEIMRTTYDRVKGTAPAPEQAPSPRVDGPGGGRMTRRGFSTGD